MFQIVKASDAEKQILFQNTAEKMNLNAAIIENGFLGGAFIRVSLSCLPLEACVYI